jgi:hypothetical protein
VYHVSKHNVESLHGKIFGIQFIKDFYKHYKIVDIVLKMHQIDSSNVAQDVSIVRNFLCIIKGIDECNIKLNQMCFFFPFQIFFF